MCVDDFDPQAAKQPGQLQHQSGPDARPLAQAVDLPAERLDLLGQLPALRQAHEVEPEPVAIGMPSKLDQQLFHAARLKTQANVSDAADRAV